MSRCVRFRNKLIDFEHSAGYISVMSSAASILVIDDDRDVLTAARLALKSHFNDVRVCDSPAGIDALLAERPVDVYLLDMNFTIGSNAGREGMTWLRRLLQRDPDAIVVMMTAFGDLNTAVRAMREGAADFVLKPWHNDKLLATMNVAVNLRRSRVSLRALAAPTPAGDMIAGSAAMQAVLQTIERAAPTDASVLIRGENGTGKELVARELHRRSARTGQPFVAVDLGAVPETLFESELFGHSRGAFTGADKDRDGRFRAAHGGTLFLDEIGNLPASSQARLLRVLESGEVTPLGRSHAEAVDVRLLSATNQPLEEMLASGRFREDLFYRLNTIVVTLPPLRDRLDDLPALVAQFLERCCRKYRLPERRVDDAAMATLRAHHWPGNVRELSHTIERALILGDAPVITPADLRITPAATTATDDDLNLAASEQRLISKALERRHGNVSRAATDLGITRAALYRRIEKFGL